jgi:hypothetical protein
VSRTNGDNGIEAQAVPELVGRTRLKLKEMKVFWNCLLFVVWLLSECLTFALPTSISEAGRPFFLTTREQVQSASGTSRTDKEPQRHQMV